MPKAARKKSINPQNSKLSRKQLTIIIPAIAGMVVAVFLVYAYIHNGSVRGFILENQKFPGANASSLVGGREKLRTALDKSNTAITGLSPIYASGLLTNEDGCKKGTHDTAISIEPSNDNFAYECSIDTKQYYAFEQSRCDISSALLKLTTILSGTDCDTSTANDNFYSVELNKNNGPIVWVMVQDKATFNLQNKDEVIDKSPFSPCNFDSTKRVYCESHDIPTKIVDKIPINSQTVVTVQITQSVYYRK